MKRLLRRHATPGPDLDPSGNEDAAHLVRRAAAQDRQIVKRGTGPVALDQLSNRSAHSADPAAPGIPIEPGGHGAGGPDLDAGRDEGAADPVWIALVQRR
jgi:hypothetical protein